MQIRCVVAIAVLLGCGGLGAASAAVEASDGESRETVPGATVGVGYFTVRNTGTERRTLLKIVTPYAERVELHQSSVDAQGIAHMWPMASLELKPGEVVRFTPNGKHLMLFGLTEPLRVGMKIPLTMQFDRTDPPVTVMLVVQPLVPAGADAGKHDHH
jgi:copper(I)-binding protein